MHTAYVRALWRTLWIGIALSAPAWAQGGQPLTTKYYTLTIPGDAATAKLYGQLLDQAYPQFAKYHGVRLPRKVGPPRTLTGFATHGELVRFATDNPRGRHAVRLNVCMNSGGEPTWFSLQPTPHAARTALLRAAAMQLHEGSISHTPRASENNLSDHFPDYLPRWYHEGVGVLRARHFWDGRTLLVGVRPLVTGPDGNAAALSHLRAHKSVSVPLRGKTSAVVSAAYIEFLASTRARQWKAWRRKLDELLMEESGHEIYRTPRKTLIAWLEKHQEPWVPSSGDWFGVRPDAIRGEAAKVSVCRLRAPATMLRATLDKPLNAGLLLAYRDAQHYTVALLDPNGVLTVRRCRKGAWTELEKHAGLRIPKNGITFQALRHRHGVTLNTCGKAFGPWKLDGATLGLAVDGSAVTFAKLKWK